MTFPFFTTPDLATSLRLPANCFLEGATGLEGVLEGVDGLGVSIGVMAGFLAGLGLYFMCCLVFDEFVIQVIQ